MTVKDLASGQAAVRSGTPAGCFVAATITAVIAVLPAAAFAAAPEDTSGPPVWAVKLGIGPGVAPTFEGSDSYEAVPVPLVEITWRDRVFIGSRGLGVYAFKGDHARLGARLGYNLGRDEDDDDALRGLGDVDPSVEAGVFASYKLGSWTLGGQISQDLADGHDGILANAGLTYTATLTKDLVASLGPNLTWASENYMRSFFGVTPAQAARSGLRGFDPESGIKDVGVNARATYSFTEHWSASVISRYARMTGDAADSPIVRSRNQIFLGTVIGYTF